MPGEIFRGGKGTDIAKPGERDVRDEVARLGRQPGETGRTLMGLLQQL